MNETEARLTAIEGYLRLAVTVFAVAFAIIGILISATLVICFPLPSRIARLESDVARVPEQIKESATSLSKTSNDLRQIDIQLAATAARVEPLKQSIDVLNTNAATLNNRLGAFEERTEPRINRIDERVDSIYKILAEKRNK